MGREKLLDLARHLDVAVRDEDEVVGDPLQFGEDVRRQHDRDAILATAAVITVAMKSSRAIGSRAAIGSSRTRSCGRRASASVNASWACWPPDIFPAFCAQRNTELVEATLGVALVEAAVQVARLVERSAAERFL